MQDLQNIIKYHNKGELEKRLKECTDRNGRNKIDISDNGKIQKIQNIQKSAEYYIGNLTTPENERRNDDYVRIGSKMSTLKKGLKNKREYLKQSLSWWKEKLKEMLEEDYSYQVFREAQALIDQMKKIRVYHEKGELKHTNPRIRRMKEHDSNEKSDIVISEDDGKIQNIQYYARCYLGRPKENRCDIDYVPIGRKVSDLMRNLKKKEKHLHQTLKWWRKKLEKFCQFDYLMKNVIRNTVEESNSEEEEVDDNKSELNNRNDDNEFESDSSDDEY